VKKLLVEFYPVRVTDRKAAAGVKARQLNETIFLDGDGDEIHRAVFGDALSLVRALEEALRRYGPREVSWITSGGKLPDGEKRPVVLAFVDDRKDTADTLKALEDRTVSKMHARFLFERTAFRRDSEEARKWGVSQAPTLVAVDPAKGEALEKISGRKGARDLKAFLARVLARLEGRK